MAKTRMTRLIEERLEENCREKRIYGCSEVTIGFYYAGKADELVDFMTIDSHDVIRCYEIKVSLADMHSNAKLSFYGDYNYFIVTQELFDAIDRWDVDLTNIGIIVASPLKSFRRNQAVSGGVEEYDTVGLEVKVKPKRVTINENIRSMLKTSLIRSIFWKMEKYKTRADNRNAEKLEAEIRHLEKDNREIRREHRLMENRYYKVIKYLIRNYILTDDELDDIENL